MPNNYQLNTYYKQNNNKTKLLTKKALNEIDNRRLYAMRLNDIEEIKEAKSKILEIIDVDGLSNDEQKIRLDAAFKALPYVAPQLKSS